MKKFFIKPVTNKNFLNFTKKVNNCLLWTKGKTKYGYGVLESGGKTVLAHRYSYELFNGQLIKNKVVMHICDTPACVNPKHLKLGSHQENIQDAASKGLMACGAKHYASKLTNKIIIKIREEYKKKLHNQTWFAKKYHVGQDQISRIINLKRWKHI